MLKQSKISNYHSNIHHASPTVLLKPSPPKISPASNPTATEGRVLNLTCSSVGGSPPPQVYWYGKEQPNTPLEANLIKGRNKDEPTRCVTYKPDKQL